MANLCAGRPCADIRGHLLSDPPPPTHHLHPTLPLPRHLELQVPMGTYIINYLLDLRYMAIPK